MLPYLLVYYKGSSSGWVSLIVIGVIVVISYLGCIHSELKQVINVARKISNYAYLIARQLASSSRVTVPIPAEAGSVLICKKYSNILHKKMDDFLGSVNVGRIYDEQEKASLIERANRLCETCEAVVYRYPCSLWQTIIQGFTLFHGGSRKYIPTQIDLNDARTRILKNRDSGHMVAIMSDEYVGLFNNDMPISSKSGDKFNRSGYADRIAQMLRLLPNNASFTVGLYSNWGYGKTSTINMVQESLKNDSNIICLNISVWNYKTKEELASEVLCAIQNAVGKETFGPASIVSKAIRTCQRFLRRVVGSDGQISFMVASKLNWTIPRKDDLKNIVDKIEINVAKSTKKIVIFIDDIDRLTSEQVINTLTLVHSVVHIKGVVYFLSLDKQATAALIERGLGDNSSKKAGYGLDYLNKIIQIPLDLAYIPDQSLDNQFWKRLKDAVAYYAGKSTVTQSDIDRIRRVYSLLNDKVKTPRDVVLCCNAIGSALLAIGDEINVGDLICIELVRVLDYELYSKLRDNSLMLTNQALQNNNDNRKNVGKLFEDNKYHLQIAESLFPRLRTVVLIDNDYNRHCGICLNEYVERYFTYSLRPGELTDSTVIDILRRDNVSTNDIRLLFRDSMFLNKIINFSSEIADRKHFLSLLVSTAETDSGSKIVSETLERSLFQKSLEVVGFIIDDVAVGDRISIYGEIIKKVASIDALALVLQMIYRSDDFEPVKEKCGDVILWKIREYINNGQLPTRGGSYLSAELYKYFIIFGGDKDVIDDYIKKRVKTANDAVDFVSQFLISSFGISSGVEYKHDLFERDVYKRLSTVADPGYLYSTIVSDNRYSCYVNISQNNVKRFHHDDLSKAENMFEQEFRDVVAQQFIYLYGTNN